MAVGSPLTPVLANIFMDFYESKWWNGYNLHKPKFYLRYVDDILAVNFLNERYPNIKFTLQKVINLSIAFVDVFISGINNQNLTLQTPHKSTYTGLFFNLKSFTSFSYKISLIKCYFKSQLSDRYSVDYLGKGRVFWFQSLFQPILYTSLDF